MNRITLVRHGETEWSLSGRHTGRTDIPLTPRGKSNAARLRARLAGSAPILVLSSPLQRARRTCELAGFGDRMQIESDLAEWDYGSYEGRTSAEIHQERPDWSLFRDGCPGGETAEDVGRRADRVIARVHWDFMRVPGATDVITFEHGEIVMSAETAARFAGEHGHSVEEELALYTVHGLLHLNGFDDATSREAARMKRIQARVLKQCIAEFPIP